MATRRPITDHGADAGDLTTEQTAELLAVALAARRRADIPVEDLRQWLILDDLPVAAGCSRTDAAVEVSRVLEVADGHGSGPQVMEYRSEFSTQPRF